MKLHFLKGLGALLLTTLASFNAQAGAGDVICSFINVGSVDLSYSRLTSGFTKQQISFDVKCMRSVNNGAQSVTLNYSVGIGNGGFSSGNQNNAKILAAPASPLLYDLFTTISNCGTLSPSISYQNTAMAQGDTDQKTYYLDVCIPQGQNVPDGLYEDLFNLTLTGSLSGSGSASVGFIPKSPATIVQGVSVKILTPPSCTLATPLDNVNFGTYTAFGGALAQTVNMNATCSNTFPYTMSIAAANTYGVLAGLNYSLSFSNTSVTNTVNVIGTGALQGTPLYAKMAAGQAGTCGTSAPCSATSAPITLTITY